jgi:uncharacterized protein (DUF1015 family)
MAFIAPFRGLRYNPEKIQQLEEVVTPPYDIIDEQAQAALYKKNPYNMIQLDLSKNFTSASLTDERYAGARRIFDRWQQEEILIRDRLPVIYLYGIDYRLPSGKTLTRKGFLSLVRLADFSEGIIKPHEKTFAKVTSDRLRLLETCHAQFSPIFSLYSDPQAQVMDLLEKASPAAPLCQVTDGDGCIHRLFAITDEAVLAQVRQFFQAKPLYIADGHHRYTTALQFRDLMRQRLGELPADSPYNHIMMYLCGMEDPGLSVLPTHRLVRLPELLGAEALAAKLTGCFSVEELNGGARETLVAEALARMEEKSSRETVFGLYHPGEDRCFLLTLRPGIMEKEFGDKEPEALRELDVVVLSDLVLDRILRLDRENCAMGSAIDYFSDPDDALDVAVKEAGSRSEAMPLLFLMNATLVSQVKRVSDEGLVMPHKSTYFYPKILTGLLINKIVPEEKVG